MFGVALMALATVPQSAQPVAENCIAAFAGRWALTAEDLPYEVFVISPKPSGWLIGEISRRATLAGPLYSTVATGPVETYPLRGVTCSAHSFEAEYTRKDDTTNFRFTRAADGTMSAELLGLPTGVVSPRFRFSRIDKDTPLPVFAGSRQRDEARSLSSDNKIMADSFEADQAIRQELGRPGKNALRKDLKLMERWRLGDAERLSHTRQLLKEGELHTGIDYWRAAFIFQHGGTAANYLYAHHLANVALKLGYRDAAWISAATLDRYLLSVGQSQIYGTQYQLGSDGKRIRQSLSPDPISDADRAKLDVPPLIDSK